MTWEWSDLLGLLWVILAVLWLGCLFMWAYTIRKCLLFVPPDMRRIWLQKHWKTVAIGSLAAAIGVAVIAWHLMTYS
jgi:hypothetical protein